MKKIVIPFIPIIIYCLILQSCSEKSIKDREDKNTQNETVIKEPIVFIGSEYHGDGLYLTSDIFNNYKGDKIILNDFKEDINFDFYIANGYDRDMFLMINESVLHIDSLKIYNKEGKLLKVKTEKRKLKSTPIFRLLLKPYEILKQGKNLEQTFYGHHKFNMKLNIPKEAGLINIHFSFKILYYVVTQGTFYQGKIRYNLVINNEYKYL